MIDRLEVPAHQEILELLPFHANDTLAGDEREHVQAHLRSCAACRRELARERELQQAYAGSAIRVPASADGLARLLATINADADRAPATVLPFARPVATPVRRQMTHKPWAAAAAVLLMVALGALTSLQVGRQPTTAPAYRTLASANALTPTLPGSLNVVLAPALSQADLERLLTGLDVTKIEARGQPGTWQVQLQAGAAPRAMLAAAAASLSRQPGVLFAAPANQMESQR